MRLYQMADAVRYEMMNTDELRETFLLEGLFQPGEIECAYVDLDRTVIGSAVPTNGALPVMARASAEPTMMEMTMSSADQ